MAAYTDSLGFHKNSAAYPAKGNDRLTSFAVELDFAKIIAARLAAGATALAATDSLAVVSLPAGTHVIAAGIQVVSAETTNTTADFDLGLTDVDVFADGATGDVVGYYSTGVGSFLATADTIDLLLMVAAPTDAVIRVFAVVADISN